MSLAWKCSAVFVAPRAMGGLLLACLLLPAGARGEVERVWLTHRTNTPSAIVVNWTTTAEEESVVRFGPSAELGEEVRVPGRRRLHQVEIPLSRREGDYHYTVGNAEQRTSPVKFQAYPRDTLRAAVVANWHAKPNLAALLRERPHVLLTAGDNISSLWPKCGPGVKDCYLPFAELIDAYPELFRSTPFLPVLGNHDREIRPRGSEPPPEPVYDIEATAFRRFFALPDDGWKWRFDFPEFGLRFLALDFNHISDHGTTWQSCHPFDRDSEQFRWYAAHMAEPPPRVVTLYNERNGSIRGREASAWHEQFRRGTACITGFGHFAERAELDGLHYFNTSLQGRGAKYPDPHSRALHGEDNYLLLTCTAEGAMTFEFKNLAGESLDRLEIPAR